MKTEELKAIGLTEEQIAEVFKLKGKEIGELNNKISVLEAEKNSLTEQINTANAEISSYKDLDIETIKKNAQDYKQKYDDLVIQSQNEMKQLQFNHTIENALTKSNAKNIKAVKSLLDLETLTNSKDLTTDLENAINALKESEAYLFNIEDNGDSSVGGSNTLPAGQDLAKMSYEDFLKSYK